MRAFKLHAEKLFWAGRAEDLPRQMKGCRLQGDEAVKLIAVKICQEENWDNRVIGLRICVNQAIFWCSL